MKAVVLAAGKGTRLLPLTEKVPKVLVEVNGRPFLDYVLENLHQAGYTEIGLVVGYLKEKMKEFAQNRDYHLTLIDQKEQRGTGHALLQAKQFCGADDFIVVGGDNFFSADDLRSMRKKDHFNYILAKEVADPRKYGVLVLGKDDLLIRIIEKPAEFVGNLVNLGLYKFTKEVWPELEKVKLSPRGEIELTDAITALAEKKKVKVIKLRDYWLDLGSKEEIPAIEKFLKEKKL